MLDIVLVYPEIPPNTGNIIRLAANTGAHLHLVEPLGFSMEDSKLKRAGLDYHELARVTVHPDLASCLDQLGERRLLALSTRGEQTYAEVSFQPGDVLMFGSEGKGLPQPLLDAMPPEQVLRIPMRADSRSLNLGNAVAVVVYEAWRQLGFLGGD